MAATTASGALIVAGCGSGDDEPVTSGGRPATANGDVSIPDLSVPIAWGAYLGDVFEGRLLVIAASADAVAALSPADATIGLDTSIVAVSVDRAPFRTIELESTLIAMSAVVDEGTAVVIGNECRDAFDPEVGCGDSGLVPRAYEIDLASASATELPAPPDDHVGARGLGVTSSGVAFQVGTSDGGEVTATWTGSGWESTPMPVVGASVCAIGDRLVAVTPAGTSSPAGEPAADAPAVPGAPAPADEGAVVSGERTPAGEPIWHATVSDDAGRTWSEPIEHRSVVEDVGFSPFTVCGPDHALVHTMQLGGSPPGRGRGSPSRAVWPPARRRPSPTAPTARRSCGPLPPRPTPPTRRPSGPSRSRRDGCPSRRSTGRSRTGHRGGRAPRGRDVDDRQGGRRRPQRLPDRVPGCAPGLRPRPDRVKAPCHA